MEQYEIDNIKTNLRQYLERNNINTNKLFNCINPEHRDSNASMKFFDDNKIYCFGCGASYNLIDTIAIMEGLDNKDAFKKAINYYSNGLNIKSLPQTKKTEKAKSPLKNYDKSYNVWRENYKNNHEVKNYLKSRGISEETANKFYLGFNKFNFENYELNALIIPISSNSFTARNINSSDNEFRYYKPKGNPTEIFNSPALTNEIPYCVMTEGEFDCLSFETIGINAISLGGVNNIGKFINAEKSLNKAYILALDNDDAGIQTTNKLVSYFKENKIMYLLFDNIGYKDANNALVNDRVKFEYSIKKVIDKLIRKQSKKEEEMT